MANISTYLEEKWLKMVFRNTEYVRPAAVYCGLVSDAASDADMEAGVLTNEVLVYTGDRKAITFGEPAQVDNKATIKNTAALEFLLMPAVTVKYAIVCDTATRETGNILYWCPLESPKVVNDGDTFNLPIDNLVLDLD